MLFTPEDEMLRGIDVSHYQGAVPFAALKSAWGLSYAFTKATQAEAALRSYDSRFARNWIKIKTAGLVRGAYSYGVPDLSAIDDAVSFVDLVRPASAADLMMLDLETSTLSRTETHDWAATWGEKVLSLTGYRPGIYMGSDYLSHATGSGLADHFSFLMYPRYPNTYRQSWPSTFSPVVVSPNLYGSAPDFWQFADTMKYGGIAYDTSVFDGSLGDLLTLQEDDMALTDTELDAIAARVWKQNLNTLLGGSTADPAKVAAQLVLDTRDLSIGVELTDDQVAIIATALAEVALTISDVKAALAAVLTGGTNAVTSE